MATPEKNPVSAPMQMSRQEAISCLRFALTQLTDDEHSACEVAARYGMMCRGFKQYSDQELRERYSWLANRRPTMAREDLERLANRWQLGRQIYHDLPCACDVQQIDQDSCTGWMGFSDTELEKYVREVTGIDARIG